MKRKNGCEWPLLLAVALGSASALSVMSQETQSGSGTNVLTLKDAIGLALTSNPQLRAAGSHIGSAAGRAYQSKLWPNPELELSAEDWPASGGGGFTDAKKLVGMAQTLPFPGKKKLDGQIGRLGVRTSEATYELRRVELVREVKAAFYEVLATRRQVEVARELVSVAESSAATARKRVDAGAAADQEQLRAEITLEQARTELLGFEREEEMAREKLAHLLGRPDLREASLSGTLAEMVDLGLLKEKPAHWLARHPEVAAARAGKQRAETEVRRARLEPYPDVTLGAAGGEDSGNGGSIVQFSLSVPVPLIDRSKGRRMEAQANVVGADAELAATEQRLLQEWGIASRRLRTAAEQAANYRDRILPRGEEALRLVRRGFEEGKFGFIDLLDTQRTAAEVRLAYQRKLLELNVAQADVEALLARVPGKPGASYSAQNQPK
ncbi:MAG TPA: TolC family protein [Candidatus Paceibacterota bacterium]|nr:TolC family protein [Verrucomicrobiota bacterium]HSA11480.1 TolC family protein [Candidatus Paceibacterota bacterium]